MTWKLSENNVSQFPVFCDLKRKPCKNAVSRKKLFLEPDFYIRCIRGTVVYSSDTCDGLITNWFNVFFFV